MSTYRLIPIDKATCRHVREKRTDPVYGYEYDVMASVAGPGGYGPCRSCLKKFVPGERRLLFLHNPFGHELGDYAGPVFVHEEECTAFTGGATLPDELADLPMFLRSYDVDGHFLEHLDIDGTGMPAAIGSLFANTAANEVHIRNIEARCFIARALRAG